MDWGRRVHGDQDPAGNSRHPGLAPRRLTPYLGTHDSVLCAFPISDFNSVRRKNVQKRAGVEYPTLLRQLIPKDLEHRQVSTERYQASLFRAVAPNLAVAPCLPLAFRLIIARRLPKLDDLLFVLDRPF